MRNDPTDNYKTIALIGNSSYNIKFMHYLFESQGIKSIYVSSLELLDLKQDLILKNCLLFWQLYSYAN